MLRFVALITLAGCGRLGFESATNANDDAHVDVMPDVVPLGHDEDGDGVRDVDDNCPHIAASQIDSDGDNVGDACDPNPAQARESITLFATMSPGDQPFGFATGDGVWTQLSDALRFDGELGPDQHLYGGLALPITLGDVRVALGIDVLAVLPDSASGQNQLALTVADQPPLYYVELNQVVPTVDYAAVSRFDGSSYFPENLVDLATGIHPGAVFLQTTQVVGTGVRLEVGWPGEIYTPEVIDAVYQGATRIEMNFNNVHFEIRYLIVIASS